MNPIEDIVNERGKDYGHPFTNHNRTARLYAAYLEAKEEKQITAHDVCMLNILQKIARTLHGSPTKDTLQDIAGYALNAQIVEETRKAKLPTPAKHYVNDAEQRGSLGEARPDFD